MVSKMNIWSTKWLVLFCCSVYEITTRAEQIQYYDQKWNYGLALTSAITENNTEVIIQLSAPTSYGWAGVGTGAHMDGALIFFIYPSSVDDQVTLSTRQAKGHTPILTTAFQTSLIESNIQNGTMSATIRWRSVNRTFDGRLDIADHKQPLIWALGPTLGPNQVIASSDVNFNLMEHADESHGVLFADMPYSQNPSSVQPDLAGSTQSINMKAQPVIYHDLVIVHALALCVAFLAIFPLGVVGLRWRWVHGFTWHWILQAFGILLALVGFGTAIAQSILGVAHDSLTEPHQLVGIALCSLLPLQAFFGRAQHLRNRIYRKWTWASWTHVIGGRLLIYGAGVNAVLGLLLVGLHTDALIAAIASTVVVAVMELVVLVAIIKKRRNKTAAGQSETNTGYHKLQDLSVTQDELHPQPTGRGIY